MIFNAILISLLVVVIVIGGYKLITGIWPGGRLIIEDPPSIASGLEDTEARFMFFYTDWCPFCTQSKDPWNSFKQLMNNAPKTYGGKTIVFEEINCESQTGKCALYNIKEYPSFKVQTTQKVYKMSGKPSVESFRAFLKSALGQEST